MIMFINQSKNPYKRNKKENNNKKLINIDDLKYFIFIFNLWFKFTLEIVFLYLIFK